MEININLSDKASLTKAIEKLKSFGNSKNFDDKVVNTLVDICYDRCMSNLDLAGEYPTTQYRAVKKAISKEYAKNGTGYVIIRPPATFVELGTGIKGGMSSHPNAPDIGWTYRDKGWVYPTDADASNPNKWQTKDGDWKAYTRGQTAKMFAYEAAMHTKQIAKEKVKISFNDIIG